ncbi:cytadherence-associated protein [Mycoplasma tullyi]|uniref:cytadherence-associated protein n=1 Tax=Mycoplasma tullyi TaxID=1612150 RepID=UPI001E3E1C57|nr:cytadherence-associated protein [Mycoplasma tullyi]
MNNKDQFNSLLDENKPITNKPEILKKEDQELFSSKFKQSAPEVNYRINYQVPYTDEDEAQDDAIIAILTKQLEDLKSELLNDLNNQQASVQQVENNDASLIIKEQLNFLENLYKSFYLNDFEFINLELLVANNDLVELKKQSYELSKTLAKAQIVFEEINKCSSVIANEISKVDLKPWSLTLNDQEFSSPNQLLTYLFDLKLEAKAKLVNLEHAIAFINDQIDSLIKKINKEQALEAEIQKPVVNEPSKENLEDLNFNLNFDLGAFEKPVDNSIEKKDLELLKEQLANDIHKITKTDLDQLREELRVDINKINQQDLINKQDLELLKQSVIKTQLELIEVNQKQLNELRQEHQAQLELAKNSQQYIVDQLADAIIRQEKILEEKINVLSQLRPINLTEMTIPSTEVMLRPNNESKTIDQLRSKIELLEEKVKSNNLGQLKTKVELLEEKVKSNNLASSKLVELPEEIFEAKIVASPEEKNISLQLPERITPNVVVVNEPEVINQDEEIAGLLEGEVKSKNDHKLAQRVELSESVEHVQPNVVVVTEEPVIDQPVIVTKEIDQLNPLTQTNIQIKPEPKIVPEIIDQELISDEVILNQPINDLNNLVKDIQVENQNFDQIKKLIQDQKIELSEIDSSYALQESINVDLPKQEFVQEDVQPKLNEHIQSRSHQEVQPKKNLANLKTTNYEQVVQYNNPSVVEKIKIDELKPEILNPGLIIDQRSVISNNQHQDQQIDQLKQKYQQDQKLLELKQEKSNAQIQVLNAQIDLLKKELVKNQELNQLEIVKKTNEFQDVLQTQKVAYESILNQHKEQYENELVNSKNELIRLINEKIQAKTNEFLKNDDEQNDFVQIRDTYLKVLSEQQKEYDKQIKQKQGEIIAKLNEQKDQFDDIIRLKNLEWNQYQEILINKNNKALAELEKQKERYQTLSQADQSKVNLINQQIKELKEQQVQNQSIIDQYNDSKDQLIDEIKTTYNQENLNQITDQITNKISEKFNEELARIKENTYNYYPDPSAYYDYYSSYEQYDEGYVDENGMYYEPVDVELDPRVLDDFNYDYDDYYHYDSYDRHEYDHQSYDHEDDQHVHVDHQSDEDDQPIIANDDQDDFEPVNHYNTEDVVIINDKIKEQLANDQSLKIRKPGGWFAKKIYLTQIGEKEKIPQKMSGRRGVFKRVNKGRLSKEEIKKYANKIINSNK